MDGPVSAAAVAVPQGFSPSLGAVWRQTLPHQVGMPVTRAFCRVFSSWGARHVRRIEGLEHVLPDRDPFILALNHSQRLEAVIVPTLLICLRSGKMIHFMADWNFLLVPLVGAAFRLSGAIIVGRKSARPRFLNALRPLMVPASPPFERAAAALAAGSAVGIFPEGTTNRNPVRLLPGDSGAARLSLATGVPVVPAGIRFPRHRGDRPIGACEPLELAIGAPLVPPAVRARPQPGELRDWHGEIMGAIARLSGKMWERRR